jgi:hypothetical protein
MSRLKDMIQQDPVHERRVEFRTYPLDNNQVIVEGWLRDERLVTGYHWDGRDRPPGVVHRLCVRLLLGEWPLRILDAEAEMPGVPQDLCRDTRETVKKVVGLSIVSGFSEEVRRLIGGVEGCAHLTYLIVAMGPAALHGCWTQRSRRPLKVPRSLDDIAGLKYLINTCRLWREGGPMIQMIRERLEKRGEDTPYHA